ncbi:MAG: ABC transporter substrate-binding protein [Lachnospiraceae bacterium]|nr:ABC transporter substrate-binding protein [Lachnospiraceae bacterium]
MKRHKYFSYKGSVAILLIFFFINIYGCVSNDNAGGFPKQYIAELHSLLPEGSIFGNVAVKDGIIYFSMTDLATTKISYADMAAEIPEAIIIPYIVPADWYVNQIYPNKDDTVSLFILKYDSFEYRVNAEEAIVIDKLIVRISLDGELMSQFSVKYDLRNERYNNASGFLTEESGRTFLLMEQRLYAWDNNGNLAYERLIPGSFPKISHSRDGDLYVFWRDGGIRTYEFAPIDPDTGTLGIPRSLRSGISYIRVNPGINSDFLMTTDTAIYEYDLASGNESEIISFAAVDLMGGYSGQLAPLSPDRVAWVQTEDFGMIPESLLFVIGEGVAGKGKKTLTLGTTFTHTAYSQYVAAFNRSNSDIRVEIKHYGDSFENNGIDELTLDIIAGKGPDIMILPSGTMMENYIKQGIFTDLYPLIDDDGAISLADLQTNIIRAFETDGKLFSIPVSYNINTIAVPTSIVGEINHWNLREMMAIVNTYLPESKFFEHENKAHVLWLCLRANTDYIIGSGNQGQVFDRELLIAVLEFANRFAPSFRNDDNLVRRAQEDSQLQGLCCHLLSGAIDHQIALHAFGEPVSYPGYPSETGNGNLISSDFIIAINNNSKDKEAAWQFASSLFNERNQSSIMSYGSLPLRKSTLEAKFAEDMQRIYYADENGERKEQPLVSAYLFGALFEGFAASEDEIALIRNIIENADTIHAWDDRVHSIIPEEAEWYFNGEKSVGEVVDIIENRLRMYFSEME